MPATYPPVTVVFAARERFALAARSAAAIFEHTRIPFMFVWVDCNYPERYRKEVGEVLAGRENVKIIRLDRFATACEQKNLAAKGITDDYICFIENDNIVSAGWLESMIDACETLDAGVCEPMLLETSGVRTFFHHDAAVGHIRVTEQDGKKIRVIEPDRSIQDRLNWTEPRIIDTVENHVLLYRRAAFEQVGGYDERLFTRQLCDISLALHQAGIRVVLAPHAVVRHYPPPPVAHDEWPFYTFIWDIENCQRSEQIVNKKWNLGYMPSSMPFVRGQYWRRTRFGYFVFGILLRGERLLFHVKRIMRGKKAPWQEALKKSS